MPHVFNQKARPFIETEDGMPGVVREVVLLEHIFHMPEVIAGNLPDTPLLTEPRLQFVFF